LEPFTTIRIKFHLKCYVRHMIIFENSEELEGISCDTSNQLGPFYNYSEIILHNYRNVPVLWNPIQGLEI
jgi:hypothetical protein